MKKLSLLLLFLAAAFALPILAQAETYTCSDHPNAGTRTYRVQYSVDRYSVVKHRIHGGTQVRCSVCNKLLHEDNRFEEHSYGGNTCSVCGQQRSSKDTLETEAQYDEMIMSADEQRKLQKTITEHAAALETAKTALNEQLKKTERKPRPDAKTVEQMYKEADQKNT
ncbi:MAG: hypothetical protein IJJ60_03320, partial [Clostridia bacterium]|nr:hypothetical protein [Clostridia bacterium]